MRFWIVFFPVGLQEGDGHQGKWGEGPSAVHLTRAVETSHEQPRQFLNRHLLHLAKGQHATPQTTKSK
jgi:hypothetical protein